ncbi:MAG TPA: hypothetical protein H9675_06570 [Firmicutes bacterium]|nr:hypothetical protein [Bacillota bacterium]
MDINVIKELIAVAKANGVSALEVEENGFKVRVENGIISSSVPMAQPVQYAVEAAAVQTVSQTEVPVQEAVTTDENAAGYDYVKSPMVGIFNSLKKLGRPEIKPGDKIAPDTVICAIEAMKMMCDIEAEVSGELVEFMCNDGDQVEFGQLLAKVKK